MIKINDIEKYVSGAVQYKKKGDWYFFSRFFEDQYPLFDDNMMFKMCAYANAGVRIRIRTDAARLEFDVEKYPVKITAEAAIGLMKLFHGNDKMPKMEQKSDEAYGQCFDLLIDGELVSSSDIKKGRVSFYLGGEKMQDVEIVFPYMVSLMIKDLTLYHCGHAEPVKAPGYVLFLGDSITQGADCVHSANTWYRKLANHLGLNYINQAIVGEMFCPDTIEDLCRLKKAPEKVFCAYGTNDWNNANQEKKTLRLENMAGYFEKLHELFPDREVYVITPVTRLDENAKRTFFSMSEWRNLMEKEASKYPNFRVVRGEMLMPDNPRYFWDGFLHPNDLGAEHYFGKLKEAMEVFDRKKAAASEVCEEAAKDAGAAAAPVEKRTGIKERTAVPIWGAAIPFNSSKSKYDDMLITKTPPPMVMMNWFSWIFGKKLMKDNHGHDDFVDRNIIKKGLAKETYEDVPTITPYLVEGAKTSVVIAPGGGFCMMSDENEGIYPAKLFNANGISAFVLSYRLEPYRFPIPCLDMQRAIRYVRHHASEFGVPADSVGAMGFSAGGYTAAGSAIFLGNSPVEAEDYTPDEVDAENGMPDYLVPVYPVVDFDTNPNMLANLKGPEFYTDPEKREQWKRDYALTDHAVDAKDVPQFLTYGTKDPLGGQDTYALVIKRLNDKSKVVVLEGAGHGFSMNKKWTSWEEPCVEWIKGFSSFS